MRWTKNPCERDDMSTYSEVKHGLCRIFMFVPADGIDNGCMEGGVAMNVVDAACITISVHRATTRRAYLCVSSTCQSR